MKDDRVYLEYIQECIEQIQKYTKDGKTHFFESTLIQDAVARRLQTMAESTQRLSEMMKSSEADVDWKAISGFRNILVHDYLGIDVDLIWRVIDNRLPGLSDTIERMIQKLK